MKTEKSEIKDSRTLYQILEVAKDASKEEIRNMFKKLSQKYHPDNKEEGNETKYDDVTRAYSILSNPEKKTIYDKYGEEGLNSPSLQFETNYDDQSKKCASIVAFLHVNLEDIYEGPKRFAQFKRSIICVNCNGSGSDNPAARAKCLECDGKGSKNVLQQMGIMLMQKNIECPPCEGVGFINTDKCESCLGLRVTSVKARKAVDIEKGSPDGYRFHFIADGNEHPKADNGDLFVEIVIKKHKTFRREGADLWYKLDLSILEAMTGFTKYIQHLNGEKLEIQSDATEIVQHGDVKVILNKGLPFFNNPKKFGNLFVEFNIVFPSEIDDEKISKVEKILPTRLYEIPKEEKGEEKEIHFLSKFKPEEENPSYKGGKSEKDQKPSYIEDEEDESNEYGGGQHHQQCSMQ